MAASPEVDPRQVKRLYAHVLSSSAAPAVANPPRRHCPCSLAESKVGRTDRAGPREPSGWQLHPKSIPPAGRFWPQFRFPPPQAQARRPFRVREAGSVTAPVPTERGRQIASAPGSWARGRSWRRVRPSASRPSPEAGQTGAARGVRKAPFTPSVQPRRAGLIATNPTKFSLLWQSRQTLLRARLQRTPKSGQAF